MQRNNEKVKMNLLNYPVMPSEAETLRSSKLGLAKLSYAIIR